MSSVIYAIVFNGEILEGHQVISVKTHLARLLKADADQIAKLFSGKQVVLKKTADKAVAIKYGTALKKVGADVRVRAIKSDAVPASVRNQAIPTPTPRPKPQPKPQSTPQSSPTASALSLAPNEGNIFDAPPEAPTPGIDVSDLSIAEAGEGTLEEPRETVTLDLDLSELNLSEPGEGTLEEPHEEVPKIDAPDFGLDEPGAVLETLKEDVEPLHPDTSGISIAEAGVELLPEEEKDPEPEPEVPDTSNIHLESNIDL